MKTLIASITPPHCHKGTCNPAQTPSLSNRTAGPVRHRLYTQNPTSSLRDGLHGEHPTQYYASLSPHTLSLGWRKKNKRQWRLCWFRRGAAATQRQIHDCWVQELLVWERELKEKYTPAFGVCAALWGQQLKRFGELHHLKAKGDVTKALEWFMGKAGGRKTVEVHQNGNIWAPDQPKAERTKAEIMSAFSVLLLLLSKTGGS